MPYISWFFTTSIRILGKGWFITSLQAAFPLLRTNSKLRCSTPTFWLLKVIDKFANGLRDEDQKKLVLQQTEKDDTHDKIIDLVLKFGAVT